jgi:polyhydroxyalkanoate synthesis repressor PhaR
MSVIVLPVNEHCNDALRYHLSKTLSPLLLITLPFHAHMARTIKRYDNRKLYDTEASSYVSQADIAELVRNGETVRIIDNSTGEDLTAQTLTQIILEEGKEEGRGLLPTDLLHRLLRRGSQAAGDLLGGGARQVGQGLSQVKRRFDELFDHSVAHLNRLTSGASAGEGRQQEARAEEAEALREQLARLEDRLADVLDRMEDRRPRSVDGGQPAHEKSTDAESRFPSAS